MSGNDVAAERDALREALLRKDEELQAIRREIDACGPGPRLSYDLACAEAKVSELQAELAETKVNVAAALEAAEREKGALLAELAAARGEGAAAQEQGARWREEAASLSAQLLELRGRGGHT